MIQERFHSYLVQHDNHLIAVGRYVEQNPVRAGLVRKAEDWPWSSAGFNVGEREDDPLVKRSELQEIAGSWRDVLREPEDGTEGRKIESHVGTGYPLGSESWVRRLEQGIKRRLRPGKPGWPEGKSRKRKKARP
jgi:putative transposase